MLMLSLFLTSFVFLVLLHEPDRELEGREGENLPDVSGKVQVDRID